MSDNKITVPLLDLKPQYNALRQELDAAVHEVIESQHFILGPKVETFERHIAEYCQTRFAVGVSSGSDALIISLMALDIQPGDEVITSAYSFFATAGAIARLGAKPVFIDIDANTFNIDSGKIESSITSRTKAIIPVHLFGQLADMKKILDLGRKYNIPVIEDAAQAIGSENENGQRAGSFGTMGCFSFFPSKNLGAFGDGGLVTTNDSDLYQKLTYLRNHGMNPKYFHKMIGGNFRLDALQAAVLDVKLKYLDQWTAQRQINAMEYLELAKEYSLDSVIKLPYINSNYRHIFNQFVILTDQRDLLVDYLKYNQIGCEIYYPLSLHNQDCFAYLSYNKDDFPVAENIAARSLALPVFPELSQDQKRYIWEKVADFFKINSLL